MGGGTLLQGGAGVPEALGDGLDEFSAVEQDTGMEVVQRVAPVGAGGGMPVASCPSSTTVRRSRQGDHERITYWCPKCQPGTEAPEGRVRPTLAQD